MSKLPMVVSNRTTWPAAADPRHKQNATVIANRDPMPLPNECSAQERTKGPNLQTNRRLQIGQKFRPIGSGPVCPCHPEVLRRVRLDSSEYLRMTKFFWTLQSSCPFSRL